MESRRPPTIAVVIVAWQDHRGLDACLAALETQVPPPNEVIVADNGAGLGPRLAPWTERLPVTHVEMGSNRGPSAARNAAVAAATSELFLFLDDDAIVEPGWIGAFVDVMADPAVAAARGRVEPHHARWMNELARAYDLGSEIRPAIINTEGNCGVPRAVLEEVGGFNEAMFGHEGAELSTRIVARFGNDAIVYVPGAVIRHDYADGLGDYVAKRFRHGMMMRHLDVASTRQAAVRSTHRSRWTWRRIVLLPVKVLGIGAEVAGFLWSWVSRPRASAPAA